MQGDRRLASKPFLVHDILNPRPQELQFLWSIRGSSFNEQSADEKADDAHVSNVVFYMARNTHALSR